MKKNTEFNDLTFAMDDEKRFIMLEGKFTPEIINNHYFLVSKTVNESDYSKRPNWQLGTDKNQLHWEVFPKLIQDNGKSLILLEFDKKCDILKFDQVKLHLKKLSNKKSVGKTLILNNIKINKN